MQTVLAARLHEVGKPMVLERLPVPEPRPTDVLVQVRACGIVPNLGNVLANWQRWFPELPLPRLPAIFGLDAAGVVADTGALVQHFAAGEPQWRLHQLRHRAVRGESQSGPIA
ncbi:MAG: alcohol dehydrogenase catalytic domain-containing protein [Stellaceae bacterium]